MDVYRLYNAATGDHLLTTNAGERDHLLQTASGYVSEGTGFQAYASEGASGTQTLERFYNAATGQHHYALTDEATAINQGLMGPGWSDEGKAFTVHTAFDLHA